MNRVGRRRIGPVPPPTRLIKTDGAWPVPVEALIFFIRVLSPRSWNRDERLRDRPREKDKEAVFQRRPELMYISSKTARRRRENECDRGGLNHFLAAATAAIYNAFSGFTTVRFHPVRLLSSLTMHPPFLVPCTPFIESLCSRHRVYQSRLITLLGFTTRFFLSATLFSTVAFWSRLGKKKKKFCYVRWLDTAAAVYGWLRSQQFEIWALY